MLNIRNFAFGSALLCACAAAAATAQPVITAVDMVRSENDPNSLYISYAVDPASWDIPSNAEVRLTPVLQYQGGEMELPTLIYAGRNAYLARKRNHQNPKEGMLIRAKGGEKIVTEVIPWNEAFTHSELTFRSETVGCRCKGEGVPTTLPVSLAMDFSPKQFNLIWPEKELRAMEQKAEQVVKTRSLSRSAYVNYKVNSTVLLTDYKSNPLELAAIVATIDSVRADKDLTVNHVQIHGYASPDGPYDNNARLADGRTEALRDYVDKHYGFGSLLTYESTAEDWKGLREWVYDSELTDRKGILEIIDSSLSPDEKDQKIKKMYPESYAVLLKGVYPTLRRADYKIDYTVKTFTEPTTIQQLLNSDPSKLSFEELMILARSYDEGSSRRSELMLQAAELFPNDERAQLNAAFTLLGSGDLQKADQLLQKAGNSATADYARGVSALYKGDKETAKTLLTRAANAGITGATTALKSL